MNRALFLFPLMLIAGCADTQYYEPEDKDIYIRAPYLSTQHNDIERELYITPHVYAIAATRAANKMLDETRSIYEQGGNVFLYVMESKKLNSSLPDGLHYAHKLTTEILEGANDYKIVNNKDEADYYLEVLVDEGGSEDVPTIVYKMILFDNKNVKVDEWIINLKQLRNDDRSWW